MMEKLKRQNSLFLQCKISSMALKTWKTRETKTGITQNFQILYPIQGGTMWKLTSQGFRKCGTFWVWQFLKWSYWLPKSGQNLKKMVERRCQKKVTATIFGFQPWNWITPSKIHIFRAWFNFRVEIQKLWPWLFLTPPNFGDAFNFAGMFQQQ